MSSVYLYPSSSPRAHPFYNLVEDNDLYQAFGGCRRGGYEDPFNRAIRLAEAEEEARRQRVVAKARARAQAEAEARHLHRLRLEAEQQRRQRLYQQRQIALARAEAERQRRLEMAAAEEASFIEAIQQHFFGAHQQAELEQRQRAQAHEQRRRAAAVAQAEAEAKQQRELQARQCRQQLEQQERERAEQRRPAPQALNFEDAFGPQFFQETFENFLAPFLGPLFQQQPEAEAATAPAAAEKGKGVDRSSNIPVDTSTKSNDQAAEPFVKPQPATHESVAPQETVRSVPIASPSQADTVAPKPTPKAPSSAGSDAGSTRGRSRSPKRARVSDVDEEGNEIATAAEDQQDDEEYVQLSDAGSDH